QSAIRQNLGERRSTLSDPTVPALARRFHRQTTHSLLSPPTQPRTLPDWPRRRRGAKATQRIKTRSSATSLRLRASAANLRFVRTSASDALPCPTQRCRLARRFHRQT